MDRIRKLKIEFNKVFSRNYGLSCDDDKNARIYYKRNDFKGYIFSERFDEVANFINCIKLAKKKRLVKRLNENFAMELGFLFGMLISKAVYDGINMDTILNDSYIAKYKLDNKIKLFFAKYVSGIVENVRYAGTDWEGCEYNTCDIKKLY